MILTFQINLLSQSLLICLQNQCVYFFPKRLYMYKRTHYDTAQTSAVFIVTNREKLKSHQAGYVFVTDGFSSVTL